MTEFKGVSIVTGAVTETEALRRTINFIKESCNPADLTEIIIGYPDRVTPQCLEVINELVSQESQVPVWAFLQSRPKLGFLTECFDAAKGSHIITVDSDLALDIGLIPQMIELAKQEPETIISASRWLGGSSFKGYNPIKKIWNFCAQKFLSVLFGGNLTDYTIPFQIVPAELFKKINFEETGFPIFLEMVLKPLRLGCKFKELPTDCSGRTEGKSSNSFLQTAMYLKTALHIRFLPKEKILK
jgi:hypothetical protein